MILIKKTKKILRSWVYFWLNGFSFLYKPFFRNKASILMYHSVSDNKTFFVVRPDEFEWQMNFLKTNGYDCIFLSELVELIVTSQKIPAKTVVLTFDDGYEDNFTTVFPILKKYGFKTTWFVATAFVGKEMTNRNRTTLKVLGWDQLLEAHNSNLVDIQPHSSGHLELDELSSESIQREIETSQKELELRLNKKCNLFAYPRGKFNNCVIGILKQNNFKAAVTVEKGLVSRRDNLFKLNRNSIDSMTSRQEFRGKLTPAVSIFKFLFYCKYCSH